MMHYVIYRVDSGEIVQTGICEESFFETFSRKGLSIMEGKGTLNKQMVKDGKITNISNVTILTDEVRAMRDFELSRTDWTQVPDAPVDREVWAAYRQALRDITEQPDFPHQVTWPTPPN